MKLNSRLAFLFLALSISSLDAQWPDKDGPTRDGRVPDIEAKDLPIEWSESKNIAWKVPLEDHGHSSPIIHQGVVWFTSANEDGTKQYVDAFEAKTGKRLHRELLFENKDPEPLGNKVNTYASPSCVTEPGAVYVHFGTYGTARLDPKTAEKVWERRDLPCSHFRGPGSSPFLYQNLIILTFDGVDQQYLAALNKETGKTVWRTDRSTDYGDLDAEGNPTRDGDLRKAYNTPTIVSVAGKDQLVSVGSRALFAYEPLTGKEIWTITHENYNAAVRPIAADGMLLINTGSSRAHVLGVKLDEEAKDDITESHVVWDRDKRNARFCRPAVHQGKLYQATEGGILSCLDIKTGKQLWSDRIDGTYMASPLVANGHLYFTNEAGLTTVLKAGDKFETVAQNKLDGAVQASPTVAGGAMFIRSQTHLYRIEN